MLDQAIIRTPLIRFTADHFNTEIYLKPENLQPFGSYKIRGIASVIKHSDPILLRQGISAASAGNMGQAIAFAAQQLNIPCRIYVPDSAPQVKKDRMKKWGAAIVEQPFERIWQMVQNEQPPAVDGIFIHPVFCNLLLQGYETIAQEILADLPDMDAIIIPLGVGGLSIALSRVIHQYNPHIAIYTCEPATAAPMHASLRAGNPTSIHRTPSFIDAIGSPEVLPHVFNLLSPLLKDSLVVSLTDVKQALSELLFNHKLLCEGAAACSLAAAINLTKKQIHRKIVCLLTGGNVSIEVFNELLAKK